MATTPAKGLPVGWYPTMVSVLATRTHPAASNELEICSSRSVGSSPMLTEKSNGITPNGLSFSEIRSCCSGFSTRGDLNFSSASWASKARAFASSDLAFAFAISADDSSRAIAIFASASERAEATFCDASILYLSNSSFERASSSRWSDTTKYVETPTIKAAIPAAANDQRIISSQPWSERPQITLRLAVWVMVCVAGMACFGLLIVAGASRRKLWRGAV
jgi:hypothetical protein